MSNKRGKTLYDRRRWVQGALVLLLAADVVLGFLTLRPAGMTFAEQKTELELLSNEARGKQAAVAHLKRVKDTLAESSSKGQAFYDQKFLPATTGFSTIMEEVDKLAAANGVRKGPVTYATQDVKDRPGIEAVNIDTSLEGDYAKIMHFINHLEQSNLFLIVDTLGVGPGQEKNQGGQARGVRLSVKLVTYFRTQGATL